MSQRGFSVVALVLALCIIAGAGWLVYAKVFRDTGSSQVMRPGGAAVPVYIAPVRTGMIRDLRTFSGSLTPKAQFIVAPKISGRLERISVDVGDPVRRNQVVARLDDAEYFEQVEQAKAELAVARANVEEARSDLDIAEKEFVRIEALRGQRVTSQAELDLSRAKYNAQQARLKVAKAQVDQRQAALRAAEVRLGYAAVRATWPENGTDNPRVVGERFVDEGATLSANAQMLSVLDISGLRAVFHVTERDYPRLRVGQQAEVTLDALPGMVFAGQVSRIAPIFREASRQARIELELDNAQGLMKPGMFIKATLELGRAEDALFVPSAALVRREGDQGVFVVTGEQKARYVSVRTGIAEGDHTQLLEPADLTGDVVVLGQHLLEDGAAVRITED
ncbi:MAG TPA: efflux RND transporter periplasmic adaptor subunit [Desulfonatronum sp.]|nr:efflux RND transporter periplasmic adaptor subunit [Desulfonatronum sp.]